MNARRFRKRIEIWETTPVSDTFGGNTVSEAQIGTSWADIRTRDNESDNTEFGVTSNDLVVEITLRKRSDLTYNPKNQFIKYNGDRYTMVSAPTDTNFDGLYIKIIAVKDV